MAALAGLGIDNCEVGVDRQEMPGCDGSSRAFVEAIDSVGTVSQEGAAPQLIVDEVVRVGTSENWIEARPALDGGYSVEFQLNFAHEPVIGQQVAEARITPEEFRREIGPCRTFVLQREAEEMRKRGLGEGITNRDLLVFGEAGPLDNSLHFSNECARHKLLDVIGDLALTGHRVVGQIVAHCSGHRLHAQLASELVARFAKPMSVRMSA